MPGVRRSEIVWYSDGGRRFSYESSVLTPCRSYQHFRNNHPGDGMPLACFQELPGCGVPGSTWGGDLARVLSHPDMVAALAAAPVIYGGDPRPFDGSVFHMEIGGKIVEVGPDVAPAGVRAAETSSSRSKTSNSPPATAGRPSAPTPVRRAERRWPDIKRQRIAARRRVRRMYDSTQGSRIHGVEGGGAQRVELARGLP